MAGENFNGKDKESLVVKLLSLKVSGSKGTLRAWESYGQLEAILTWDSGKSTNITVLVF